MITQPTNITPSTVGGTWNGIIDVNDGLQVTWQFSGSPMLAYSITIYQNDTNSTQMFATGKVVLDTPFYPYDFKGNIQTFNAVKITASDLETAGIVNGYDKGYKFIITMWYGDTDAESVTQTSASTFITRDAPVLSINPITNPYDSRSISVTANYSQAQGDTVIWARWVFINYSIIDTVIEDTGEIETSVLRYDYDGLLSGTTYRIKLYIQTSSGVEVETPWSEFSVDYATVPSNGVVTACRRFGQPCVQVEWTNKTTIQGIGDGQISFPDGKMRLDDGASVTWEYIDSDTRFLFKQPWSLSWRGTIPSVNTENTKVELETEDDSYFIKVGNNKINLYDGSSLVYSQNATLRANDTIVVVVTPDHIYIKQVTFSGGLLPANDLYPSNSLYPQDVTTVINTWDSDITLSQRDINGIVLHGEQTCDFLWLHAGSIEQSIIDNLMGNNWYEPVFDGDTYFLADFVDGNLNATIVGGNGDTVSGVAIYRQDGNNATLKHIVDIDNSYLLFRDYCVKSNMSYKYVVFPKGETTYTSMPYESDTITPQFGSYTLMVCDEDENGVNHVTEVYSVACNIDSGSISNNNKPNVYDNFTRYPVVEKSPSLYKSGTLTALVGTIDNNTYSDSWELANRIMGLSISNSKKFLRDMKGEIWQIETNGAITADITDTSASLPIRISFPWVEVGDADSSAIVLLPSDELWEDDMIGSTTIEIDLETGSLLWTVPDNYSGSTLRVRTDGSLEEVGTGYTSVAQMRITEEGYLIATI